MSFPARFAPVAAAIVILLISGSGIAAQEDRVRKISQQADQASQDGKLKDAVSLAQEAVQIAEGAFGEDSWQLATTMGDLGQIQQALGRYSEAETQFKQALGILEKLKMADGSRLAEALDDLGGLYEVEGRPLEAELLCERALRIQEKNSQPESLEVARRVKSLGVVYDDEGKYGQAESTLDRALSIEQKILKSDDAELAKTICARATLYRDEGKYELADKMYRQAIAIQEKVLGHDHPDLAYTLVAFGLSDFYQEKLAEAVELFKHSQAIQEKSLGPDHPMVAVSLQSLGDVYTEQGKFEDAEALYRRAMAIDEKSLGRESQAVAYDLNGMGEVDIWKGEFSHGEATFRRSLAILEKFLGREHPVVASSLNNLADTCLNEGKFVEAEMFLKRSIAIREKIVGADNPDLAPALNNLAELDDSAGKFGDAEPLLRRVIALDEKTKGDSPGLATDLNNLASLFVEEGKYEEAGENLRRATSIWEKTLTADHPRLALAYGNLGLLYDELKQYDQAEAIYRRSLTLSEKVQGLEHPEVATTLNNLAELFRRQKRFTEAEPLYIRSLAIRQKSLGPAHPMVAQSKNNLAMFYKDLGEYDKAERLFQEALATDQAAFGAGTPSVVTDFFNLADLYYAKEKSAEAQESYESALGALERLFAYSFTYMGEKDRLSFLKKYQGDFPSYFTFCTRYGFQNPELLASMYDVLLWHKGMVSQSVTQLFAAIEATGDQESLALLGDLSAKRKQLATLLESPADDFDAWRRNTRMLQSQAEELESRLVRVSSLYAEKRKLQSTTLRDVQNALHRGEAAVEFVRFELCDGKRCSGKFEYVALVLTPEMAGSPALVNLGDARELEGEDGPLDIYRRLALTQTRSSIPKAKVLARFYQKFWKPIEPYLENATTVYVSPDGVLNQVSLGIVPTETGEPLLQKYDLRIVTSTRDLVLQTENERGSLKTAVLVGNPKYSLSEDEYRLALNDLQSRNGKMDAEEKRPGQGSEKDVTRSEARKPATKKTPIVASEFHPNRSRGLQAGGPLEPLPGTAKEISAIKKLFGERNWEVTPYENESALEEAVKTVRSPRVLHIATHGFFEQEQRTQRDVLRGQVSSGLENPMMRSGLYFAGADRALAKKPIPEGQDDGVLTAYEAMTMNLQGTELVVLSACETGLGEAASGEGVFGLLRAFKEAGAESIMVSMWKVPDEETQELMKLFYEKWLSGMEKHQALREAQLEMRARIMEKNNGIDFPYYWGAFVLVGRS